MYYISLATPRASGGLNSVLDRSWLVLDCKEDCTGPGPGLSPVLHKLVLVLDRSESWSQQIDIIDRLLPLCGITERALKKVKKSPPSFSHAEYPDLAGKYGLPIIFRAKDLANYSAPEFYVYIQDHFRGEATKVRFLDAFIVPLLAIARGRIIDTPEETLPATQDTSGGAVEHEILALNDGLFFVIEVKLHHTDLDKKAAQLFLEMLSAAKLNEARGVPAIRVYGLITDLNEFNFYSYDPVKQLFFHDTGIHTSGSREHFLIQMVEVSNKIFSILLVGYIGVLEALIARESTTMEDRKTYEAVLVIAHSAETSFSKQGECRTIEALERHSMQAYETLQKRSGAH
ncbi:uncharacterized protein PHACADRAFT_190760 [Phanerochaete carnosa HHB-10118-sp]|uniref:Uncharacterized protein n=1 Tax=Phanerochaete carnosa (strain HHB-10118-sp) TaxID=650164 RepID=K5WQQ0_PHACS|nr:uncharacterized protein PHACADRAFT_190760 [Phanerochaete carnosa HHB-10118-sp]EKM61584.1 hypothetical protein PHACADRAFT_190760 [Phanerochaete carnosa HHB-10118-sp]